MESHANHVILLVDRRACQDVRFTCRHSDRFAKHASLPGNGVTTHRAGMKAERWLGGGSLLLYENSAPTPQLSREAARNQHAKQSVLLSVCAVGECVKDVLD